MSTHKLRTFMEHHLLPDLVFKYHLGFITDILKSDGDSLAFLYQDVAKENNDVSPYSKEDFKVIPVELKGGYKAVEIILPRPQEELECFCIILSFKLSDEEFSNLRFFTIEKGVVSPLIDLLKDKLNQEISLPDMILCEWTKDHVHQNYGPLHSVDEIQPRIEEILTNQK